MIPFVSLKSAVCFNNASMFSFAANLLGRGYDILTIQELLGHKDVKTTIFCTHDLNCGGKGVKCPHGRHVGEKFRGVIEKPDNHCYAYENFASYSKKEMV